MAKKEVKTESKKKEKAAAKKEVINNADVSQTGKEATKKPGKKITGKPEVNDTAEGATEKVKATPAQAQIVMLLAVPTAEKLEEKGFKRYDHTKEGTLYEFPTDEIKNVIDGLIVRDLNGEPYPFKKSKHKTGDKVFLLLPKI